MKFSKNIQNKSNNVLGLSTEPLPEFEDIPSIDKTLASKYHQKFPTLNNGCHLQNGHEKLNGSNCVKQRTKSTTRTRSY